MARVRMCIRLWVYRHILWPTYPTPAVGRSGAEGRPAAQKVQDNSRRVQQTRHVERRHSLEARNVSETPTPTAAVASAGAAVHSETKHRVQINGSAFCRREGALTDAGHIGWSIASRRSLCRRWKKEGIDATNDLRVAHDNAEFKLVTSLCEKPNELRHGYGRFAVKTSGMLAIRQRL